MDRFVDLKYVGEGSFGKVYRAVENKNARAVVALKIIQKRGRSAKELKGLRKECEIQSQLRHPNIIQMFESFETKNEIVVVTEYAKGDLHSLLAREGSISEVRAQKLTCDLVSALYYLHSHRILHRDLKPQNILLDKYETAKLCDFGLARNMTMGTHVLTSIKGTPLYMAPELMAAKPYDYCADLWSLGCIVYEVLAGQTPFCSSSIVHLAKMMQIEHVKWPSFLTMHCLTFLQGLLEKNPKNRMTWPQILNHSFVKGQIKILDDDFEESPFTQSMTDSQTLEKRKQTNQILYGTRSPIHKLVDENPASSRDSIHAIIQSDIEGLETDNEETNNQNYNINNNIAITEMFNQMRLNEIMFVPENPNLVVNRMNDNFPVLNPCQMFGPQRFQFNSAPINLVQNQNTIKSAVPPATSSVTKSVAKNSELERKKLNQNLENFSVRLGQSQEINERRKSSNITVSEWNNRDDDSAKNAPIENEEWIAFLHRSMQEIIDGELDSVKQQNLVSIIVTPLRNNKASFKVLENVAQLLSLPLVLYGLSSVINEVQSVYVKVKLVPNLVYASKLIYSRNLSETASSPIPSSSPVCETEPISYLNADQIRTISALYELCCHLVHLDNQFLTQFCDALAVLGADKLLRNFLSLESDETAHLIRLKVLILALLCCSIREMPENAELVEKIIFGENVNLVNLLRHSNQLIKLRMCMLFRFLGRYSCRALQTNWNSVLRDALELLACEHDDKLKNEAESLLAEFKNLSFYAPNECAY